MDEMREFVMLKQEAREQMSLLNKKDSTQRTTILVLQKRLLKARNKLAVLEKDLENRQLEFDTLVKANEANDLIVANHNLAKHEKRLSAAIMETEYATTRMESALAALNERLTAEYNITKQISELQPPPPQVGEQQQIAGFVRENAVQKLGGEAIVLIYYYRFTKQWLVDEVYRKYYFVKVRRE